jgi:alkaline phosphatase
MRSIIRAWSSWASIWPARWGKSLGIATTADVFDATPAAWAVHTSNRNAGTGICDQYLDEVGAQGEPRQS